MFTILDVPQRSEEWRLARLGRLTGSRAADMLAKIKTGEAAARRDYRIELVVERLTGCLQEDGYVSKEMQRGLDLEERAFVTYEAVTGCFVRRTGFCRHDELMAGCSLDGDVEACSGIVELKCPKSATHLQYWQIGTLPNEHRAQVTHNLWITGAAWADFVSFDDRFPKELQFFRVRVRREDLDLAAYEAAARAFLSEVDVETATVQQLVQKARRAA